MPISSRQVALAAALSFAIAACAQPPAASMPAATSPPPHRDQVESAPAISAKEADAMSEPATAEPERGPAIAATELRKKLLTLFGSFRSLKDLERGHVEPVLGIRMARMPDMDEGYFHIAHTTEGWLYRIEVDHLGRTEDPPTILIDLDDGADPGTSESPAHCTLEFEPLAKELVAMGYEQDPRAYNRGGDIMWGFGRESAEGKASFGIGITLYERILPGNERQVCIKGFNVGGGAIDG